MPRVWRRRLLRTATAALVLSLIGIAAWVLMLAQPQFKDLWLVLIGVLGAGAVGAWRADIDAEGRQRRNERDLVLRAIDDTQTFVQREMSFYLDRDTAARAGQPLPSPIELPLLTDNTLAGDAEVIIEWLRVDAELNRFDPRVSVEEARRLTNAALGMRGALMARRVEVIQGTERTRLTEEEAVRVNAIFAEMVVLQNRVTNEHVAAQPEAEPNA
jgi:hypothetical protein